MISATPEFVLMVSEKELLVDQIYSGELDTIGLIVVGVTAHNCMVSNISIVGSPKTLISTTLVSTEPQSPS